MQRVVICGETVTKGYKNVKMDDDGNLVIQLEGATVNIGDVDVASIAAGTNLIGKVGIDQVTANANRVVDSAAESSLSAIDAKLPALSGGKVPVEATVNVAEVTKKVQLHANIDISQATAYTAIAAPSAGNRIRLCQLILMSGATTPINSEVGIKSGSTLIKTVRGAAIVLDFLEHCNLGTAEALVLLPTTADRIVGGVDYYVEVV